MNGKHKQAKNKENGVFVKSNTIIDFVFLLTIFLVMFGFSVGIALRGQKSESVIENRTLNKLPRFNFGEFVQGKYQDNLEKALSDQMVMGQTIKENMTVQKAQWVSSMQTKILSSLNVKEEGMQSENEEQIEVEKPKVVRNIKYIPISNGVYHYGDSEYMVFKYREVKNYKTKIDEIAKGYNNE